jgi:outer membrane immunogenic protein
VIDVAMWTGCYIGGHLGGGWGHKDFTNGTISGAGAPPGSGLPTTIATPDASVDVDGVIGGGQIGCDYQFHPNWLIGIEGTFSGSEISGDNANVFFTPLNANPIGPESQSSSAFDTRIKTAWMTTLVAHLGFVQGPMMLYGVGGVAWVRDKYEVTGSINVNSGSFPNNFFCQCGFDVTADETRHGYVVGAGLAGLSWGHWSGFVEYDFLNFGTRTVALTGTGSVAPPPSSFSSNVLSPAVAQFDIKQQIHVFKTGLNYRF